jgi:hypothetical protein
MSIASTTSRNNYTGNGATSVYSYSFRIFAQTDLLVTVSDTSGNETTLVLTTDYTVSGVGAVAGGAITLVSAGQAWLTAGNLTTDYTLAIRRVRPLTQSADIRNQGDFYPEGHEDAFDHGIMVAQQQQDEIDRSVKVPETVDPGSFSAELPVPSADKYLKFNAAADGLEAATLVSSDISITGSDANKVPVVNAGASALELKTIAQALDLLLTTRGDFPLRGASTTARKALGANNTVLASDGTDLTYRTVTALLDALFSSTQGALLFRSTSAWDDLAPGTAYQLLKSQGSGADVAWADGTIALNRDVTSADVVSTAAETTVYSFSVPANSLGSTRALRLTMIADYLNNSGSATQLIIKVKLGTTTVLTLDSTAGAFSSNATRRPVRLEAMISAANATNAQVGSGSLYMGGNNGVTGQSNTQSTLFISNHNAVAEDTTSAKTLSITVQHDASHASLSFIARAIQLELV